MDIKRVEYFHWLVMRVYNLRFFKCRIIHLSSWFPVIIFGNSENTIIHKSKD